MVSLSSSPLRFRGLAAMVSAHEDATGLRGDYNLRCDLLAPKARLELNT